MLITDAGRAVLGAVDQGFQQQWGRASVVKGLSRGGHYAWGLGEQQEALGCREPASGDKSGGQGSVRDLHLGEEVGA